MKDLEIILKNIKKKELLPIYFFHGEEPYFIDVVTKFFENNVLTEDEKAFNQMVIYGKDTNYTEILSLAQQFPMMGDKQLIIVKEAQDLKLKDGEDKLFEKYISAPVSSTILVFAHKNKKLDGKRTVTKKLTANKLIFLSEPIKDWELAKYIQKELATLRIKTTPEIPNLLADFLGNNLSRIVNELAKLQLILKENEILDANLVEKHIGISKEFNYFELQKAIATKNENATFRIAHFMGKNPKTNPIVMTIGNLYTFFSNTIIYHTMIGESPAAMASVMNINPYFIKDYADSARNYPLKNATRIISILRDIDLKSKGLGANQTEESELLKELVYKILHIDQIKVKL